MSYIVKYSVPRFIKVIILSFDYNIYVAKHNGQVVGYLQITICMT